jgi:adenylate cyclase class 2
MNNIEIEIQVNIRKKRPLTSFLEKNAVFQRESHQVDEYFSPSHKNFIETRPIKEWFRLRDSDGKYFITYKNYHYDKNGKSTHCDEYETSVGDMGKLKKMWDALNFKSLVIVDKIRKTWVYKNYEISIDSVKSLGDFVEIEYIGRNGKLDPKKVTNGMMSFLKNIGCGEIKRNYVGYPFQLMFPGEIKEEIQG